MIVNPGVADREEIFRWKISGSRQAKREGEDGALKKPAVHIFSDGPASEACSGG